MHLVTYEDGTGLHVGVIYNEHVIALDSLAPDMLALIAGGAALLTQVREVVQSVAEGKAASEPQVPLAGVRLRAPIPRPRKNIVCLGKNYAAHAVETSRALGRPEHIPDQPVFFTKAPTAVNHPEGTIPYRATVSTELDWEVELAVIIGRDGSNISRDEAMGYVFGYTILNDVTARDLQRRHRQYYKGKSLDGCAPLGPWIVTSDAIADPHHLGLRLRVNGRTMQEATTAAMIHQIPDLIAILSQGMTLEAGDILATGTPQGVGMAMEPPCFLQPGDVVEAEVDGIGVLRNYVAGQ